MNYFCMLCMQRVSSSSSPPRGSIGLNACPTCGATCWNPEVPEQLKNKVVTKLCTECAIRQIARPGKVAKKRKGKT